VGFPEIASTGFAISEPALIGQPPGVSGYAISRVDPAGRVIVDPQVVGAEPQQSPDAHQGAYAPASRAEVPIDLRKALDNNPKASAFFATLNGRNRFAILYRIGNVKKAETRARKIAEFVAMLERGETIHG
jgi:hypothetical protein